LMGTGVQPGLYEELVEVVDLAPTIAELLAIPEPEQLDGHSLREAVAR